MSFFASALNLSGQSLLRFSVHSDRSLGRIHSSKAASSKAKLSESVSISSSSKLLTSQN